MSTYNPADPSTWAGYAPALAMGDQQSFIGALAQDEIPPAAANPVLHNAYRQAVVENQIIKLWQAALASAQYQQTFACASGLAVGNPAYLSGVDTVAIALATSQAASQVVGFVASKPTTITCKLVHLFYVSGLSGLTAGAPVFLSDTGTVDAAPGTYRAKIGVAISTTEALLFANPLSAAGNAGLSGNIQLSSGGVSVSAPLVTATSKIFLTYTSVGGTQGNLRVGTITPGTGFTIASSSGTDSSYVNWLIVN